MAEKYIEEAKNEMDKAMEFLKKELGKLKAGGINPALLEDLSVDYYGTNTPLKQLATITVAEPRVLTVQPFDKNSIKAVESAINDADLGVSVNVDKDIVRIISPELTEERRKELAKIAGQKSEESRIILRNAREEAVKGIKELESNGDISEDDKYKAQEKLDNMVGEYNAQVKEMEDSKEKEIMTV